MRRMNWFKSVIDNTPILLMRGSKIYNENLRKARVAESDLRAKLREANVSNLDQVRAVVFETTGKISVIHTEDPKTKFDNYLLDDVKK